MTATPIQSAPVRAVLRTTLILAVAGGLGACNMVDRLSKIGETPEMSHIANPHQSPGYQPVSMPMPAPVATVRQPNSLWREGSRAFFKDQRASRVGDILTVVVSIEDNADIENRTRHDRADTDDLDVNGLFGAENLLAQALPGAETGDNLVNLGTARSTDGRGRIERNETIGLRVAAVVTQKLPNGNMVLFGRQEVRVNFEVREVVVGGIIRPEDISALNTISYDQMAEARISYGGRGQITDLQQPRYGRQVLDVILPF